jgi:putative membrane protein
MQWWCSAQHVTWTWRWRAYPGVWLLVLALIALLVYLPRKRLSQQGKVAGVAAAAVLWIALDWPLGPLGAGYLATAHALQFLLISMVVAPMMLLPVREAITPPRAGTFGARIGWITNPVLAGVVFNLVAVATHVPAVLDSAMVTMRGDFALDMAWLLSAALFWWPIIVPVPVRPRFGTAMKILYLVIGTLFHSGIAVVFLLREYPMYRIYELAPPMSGLLSALTAVEDQRLAGGVMELGGAGLTIAYMTVLFFRMAARSEGRLD